MEAAEKIERSYLAGIAAEEVELYWPLVEGLIEKAMKRTGLLNTLGPADFLEYLQERKMQLWIAHKADRVIAVAITEILVFPKARVIGVPILGAVRGSIKDWFKHVETIKDFGREHGCTYLRGWGRKGWEKLLKPDICRIEFDLEIAHEDLHKGNS